MNLKFSLWLCIGMAMALFVSNEGIAADTAKIAFERVNLVDGRGGPVQPEDDSRWFGPARSYRLRILPVHDASMVGAVI